MKRLNFHCMHRLLAYAGTHVALTMLLPAMAPAQTNWTAYNDHTASATTAPNATRYSMNGRSIATAPVFTGPLNDLATGTELPVTFLSTAVGAPDDFGTMAYPNAGTPAYNLFNGIVDLGNVNSGIGCRSSSGSSATLVFTGLDPSKRYIFRGTAVRGNNYARRWTVCTIQGAASATDAHTVGVYTSVAFPTGGMTNGQAAFNSGENRSDGALIGWDNIDPGPDGSFSVLSEQYVANPLPNGQTPDLTTYGYGLCGMMLAELGGFSPISIVTQPAAETSVTQFRNFTLSVTVQGTLPQYQWYKEGVGAIAGATKSTLTWTNTLLADAGNYYVVITNSANSVTSALAHVTVVEDLVKPTLVSAVGSSGFTNIVVQFSEELDPVTAVAEFTYEISGNPAGIVSSTLLPGGTAVQLNLDVALAPDTLYTVTVTGVKDFSGNEIIAGSTVQFRSWISSGCNGIAFDVFTGLSTTDNSMGQLTNNVNFPNNPAERYTLTRFDTREVFPDDLKEGYGGRLRGLFIAPYSGLWRFFIRSDDGSILYVNTNGPSASGKSQVAIETGCCNAFQAPGAAQTSAAFPMTAGSAYYIEAIYKEGTGGDFCQVAARAEGDTNAPANLAPIPGIWLGLPGVPVNVVGPVSLLQQPASTTVPENTPSVVFSAQGTNVADARICYQWQRSDAGGPFVDIPNALGPTYSIAFPTVATDNGDIYRCLVQVPGSAVTSTEATLTVTADTTRPRITRVLATNSTTIIVDFSEPLKQPDSADAFNFELDPLASVSSAEVPPGNPVRLVLTTSPMTLGTLYTLKAKGPASDGAITDPSGNTLNPDPTLVTFRAQNFLGNPDTLVALPTNNVLPIGALTHRGILGRIVQIPGADIANDNAVREQVLAGVYPSATNPAVATVFGGSFIETNAINYDRTAATNTAPFGHITPDLQFPGFPLLESTPGAFYNNMTMEAVAYVQLQRGIVRMGVNSDDGFTVTPALSATDPAATNILGQFNGGRGAADTIFDFIVEQDGLYPFRLMWEQGNGGANVEWWVLDENNGVYQPINSATNGPAAFVPPCSDKSVTSQLVGTKLLVQWPDAGLGHMFVLQQAGALGSPTVWSNAVNIPQLLGGSRTATIPVPASGNAIFRLNKAGPPCN